MCQSPEIHPRISQTPLCTEITVRLCLLSLPAPSHLPSLPFSAHPLPSLRPQPLFYLLPAVIFSTPHSVLSGRNQPWQTSSLSLQLLHSSWIEPGGLGTVAGILKLRWFSLTTWEIILYGTSFFLPSQRRWMSQTFSSTYQ